MNLEEVVVQLRMDAAQFLRASSEIERQVRQMETSFKGAVEWANELNDNVAKLDRTAKAVNQANINVAKTLGTMPSMPGPGRDEFTYGKNLAKTENEVDRINNAVARSFERRSRAVTQAINTEQRVARDARLADEKIATREAGIAAANRGMVGPPGAPPLPPPGGFGGMGGMGGFLTRGNWRTGAVAAMGFGGLSRLLGMGGQYAGGGAMMGGMVGGPVGAVAGGIGGFGIDVAVTGVHLFEQGLHAVVSLTESLLRKSISLGMEWQKNAASFETMTGSAEAGSKLMTELRELAIKTPYTTKEYLGMGQTLLGGGIAGGQVPDILNRLGDIAGGDPERLKRLTDIFTQVTTQGHLDYQLMRRLRVLGLGPADMSRALGMSQTQFVGESRAHEIGTDQFYQIVNFLTNPGGRFHGRQQRIMATVPGALSNLEETFDRILTTFSAGRPAGGGKPAISGMFDRLGVPGAIGGLTDFLAKGEEHIPAVLDEVEKWFNRVRGLITDLIPIGERMWDSLVRGGNEFMSIVGTPTWEEFRSKTIGWANTFAGVLDKVIVPSFNALATKATELVNKLDFIQKNLPGLAPGGAGKEATFLGMTSKEGMSLGLDMMLAGVAPWASNIHPLGMGINLAAGLTGKIFRPKQTVTDDAMSRAGLESWRQFANYGNVSAPGGNVAGPPWQSFFGGGGKPPSPFARYANYSGAGPFAGYINAQPIPFEMPTGLTPTGQISAPAQQYAIRAMERFKEEGFGPLDKFTIAMKHIIEAQRGGIYPLTTPFFGGLSRGPEITPEAARAAMFSDYRTLRQSVEPFIERLPPTALAGSVESQNIIARSQAEQMTIQQEIAQTMAASKVLLEGIKSSSEQVEQILGSGRRL